MSNSERVSIYKEEPLTLFVFNQDSTQTVLRLSAVQTAFKRRVYSRDHRGQSVLRRVRFKLCGLDLSNSFPALSRTLALVKVFEHRQFGIGDKAMAMALPTPNEKSLRLYCRLVAYKQAYEGLEIGWASERDDKEAAKSHTMPIGYVHDFRNALHKAMGWIAPGTEIEYVELPDITYTLPEPKPEDRRSYGYGYGYR